MYKFIKKQYYKAKAWMDYNPPGAMSSKGWRLFNDEFKKNAPIRYYLLKEFRYKYILPVKWTYKDIRGWIRYRTYDRYHVIKTGLKPGYYDIDTRMLHGCFEMLKEFVEVEQAWRSYWGDNNYRKTWCEEHAPFYYVFKPFRRPDIGIKHFEWAATLDDPALPPYERCESQAEAAREVLVLYKWWVIDRPARKEIEYLPYNKQGLGDLGSLDDDFDRTAPDYIAHRKSMEDANKQEEDWHAEDDSMLARLVKVRRSLWT